MTAMFLDELTEGLQAFPAFAGSGENHGVVFAVQVDKYHDVFVPFLRKRLVQADGFNSAQVNSRHGHRNVVAEDAPQPLVSDSGMSGHCTDKHFPDQRYNNLLKEKRVATPFPCPRNIPSADAILWTLTSRDLCCKIAVLFEKIEIPPVFTPWNQEICRSRSPWGKEPHIFAQLRSPDEARLVFYRYQDIDSCLSKQM